MSVNMVANQSVTVKLSYLKGLLVKLKMSKDKSCALNVPEWEEGLKTVFANSANLRRLLFEYSSLQVPGNQVARLQIQREMAETMKTIRDRAKNGLTMMRLEGAPKTLKKENMTEEMLEQLEAAQRARARDAEAALEICIRERANKLVEKMLEDHASAKSRGVKQEVIFLDILSGVPVEKSFWNPNATVEVTVDGEEILCEPESEENRTQRMVGWQLITSTLSDMPTSNWKSVAVGDVYGLYNLITSHYRENSRKTVVKELHSRLSKLTKSKTELFVTFETRYQEIAMEMEKVGIDTDSDVLYSYVESAIEGSDDVMMTELYGRILLGRDKPDTVEDLFRLLGPAMKRHENDARTRRDLVQDKTEGKKEEWVHKAQTRDSIMGVCLEYSGTGKCSRVDCSFRHERLSQTDYNRLKAKLEEIRKKKKEGGGVSDIVCYACHEKGHYASECPKKVRERTKTAREQLADDEGKEMVREMTEKAKMMTDEQVEQLARWMMESRVQAAKKD
jgi:hypothetical protein